MLAFSDSRSGGQTNVRFPRNRKFIAGACIWGTASIFMLAIMGTRFPMSLPILIVYIAAVLFGGGLFIWGAIEATKQKKLGNPTRV